MKEESSHPIYDQYLLISKLESIRSNCEYQDQNQLRCIALGYEGQQRAMNR